MPKVGKREAPVDSYANVGPHGEGRDKKNVEFWVARATANSQLAPRAKHEMELPDNGGRPKLRDTSMKPFEPRSVNRRMAGKDD